MKFFIICCQHTCDPKAEYLLSQALRKVFVNCNNGERQQRSSMFGTRCVYCARDSCASQLSHSLAARPGAGGSGQILLSVWAAPSDIRSTTMSSG